MCFQNVFNNLQTPILGSYGNPSTTTGTEILPAMTPPVKGANNAAREVLTQLKARPLA